MTNYILAPNGVFQNRIGAGNYPFSPNVFQPADTLTPEQMATFGVSPLTLVAPPVYDAITQRVMEIDPTLSNGSYHQAYSVIALDAQTIAVNQSTIEAARISSLWQAAHDYEYAQVSGSAIGLLAMGVMQAKPRCLAVQNWIKTIWTEYYTRKAGTSTNYDFSVAGTCPHSVPELMVELGL